MAVVHPRKTEDEQWTASPPKSYFIICCLLFQTLDAPFVETLNCSQPTTESLLTALRENYFNMTEVRPVINLQTPTNVVLDFTIYSIMGVEEKAQVLRAFIWLRLTWKIEGLAWDPQECGTSAITVPRDKLWKPDIVIRQFMDKNRAPTTFYVAVDKDGTVADGQPFNIYSSCNLDIYTFPFDIQNCTYTFSSYKHCDTDVQLSFLKPAEDFLKVSLGLMKSLGEWELKDLITHTNELQLQNAHAKCSYSELDVFIVLKRQPTQYVVNLLVPSFFLLTVDLFSFLLPPHSIDRAAFKMNLILGYTVFLLLMNSLLPTTGNRIPLINVFLSICLALMVASLLETIVITNFICGSDNHSPLPNWVRMLVLRHLARLVGLAEENDSSAATDSLEVTSCSPKRDVSETNHKGHVTETGVQHKGPGLEELRKMSRNFRAVRHQLEKHFTSEQHTEEWVLLGQVIDRLIFSLYILFITVSFIVILAMWLQW